MKKYKEEPVRNNPGIYKRFVFDDESRAWKDTGKFRAIRRIRVDGKSRKESLVFEDLRAAKAFRAERGSRGSDGNLPGTKALRRYFVFGPFVRDWKEVHYLKLQQGTIQTYDKRLPNLDFLKSFPIEDITVSVVDKLVAQWRSLPPGKNRSHFDMELDLLKTVLNYYKRRHNALYVIPVLEDHYKAARFSNEAKRPVESLTEEELGQFLTALREGRSPHYYSLALVQFGLGLRIGEVCGLCWECINLRDRSAIIDRQIEWDQATWEPKLKMRPKNGKARYVAIPEAVAQELERLRLQSDPRVPFVFHRNGVPHTRNKIAPAYNRALKRIGVTRVSGTHLLRKTSGTMGTDETGNFFAVSQFLGHSSPQETLRYVKPLSGQKVEVARALDSVLGRVSHTSPNPVDKTAAQDKGLEPNAKSRAPIPPCNEANQTAPRGDGGDTSPVPICPTRSERPKLYVVKSGG